MDQGAVEKTSGWVVLAGVLILIAGIFNVIIGIAALDHEDYFSVNQLLFGDLEFWGWTWLILGALQVLTSFLLFARSTTGLVLAVIFLSINAIDHLVAVGAYPIWSLVVFALDIMILYGLMTNADEFE